LDDPTHQVKASVGATGAAVFIDTRNSICYASRLGTGGAFMAKSKGAFNAVKMEVTALASDAPHR